MLLFCVLCGPASCVAGAFAPCVAHLLCRPEPNPIAVITEGPGSHRDACLDWFLSAVLCGPSSFTLWILFCLFLELLT